MNKNLGIIGRIACTMVWIGMLGSWLSAQTPALSAAEVPQDTAQPTFDGPLKAYYNYLEKQDRTRMESLPPAVAEFERLFSQTSGTTCDSAYVLLEDFAMLVLDHVSFNEPLLKMVGSTRSDREKQSVDKYVELLKKNYFVVNHNTYAVQVRPDMDVIREKIGRFLSEGTHRYFDLVTIEEQHSYKAHDSLLISWADLAKRLTSWDKFTEKYPDNLFFSEARQWRDAYLEILIFGLTGSPICGPNGRLNPEVEAVYKSILRNPAGFSGKVVADYWKVLSSAKFRCAAPSVLFFTY